MIVNGELAEHILAGGNLVGNGCIVAAYALYETFCKKRKLGFALEIQHLVLDGRATAIENQNIH